MRLILLPVFAVSLISFSFSESIFASDHIDGPVTSKNPQADLTDLFAFPTPRKPGFLSLVLDAYPIVSAKGHFTDKVNYNILIRKAQINLSTTAVVAVDGKSTVAPPMFTTSDEVMIQCKFKTPNDITNHFVMCKSSNGLKSESRYQIVVADSAAADFRVYSGMRADPFFFNSKWTLNVTNNGKIGAPEDDDILSNINVLTIVIEIDMNKLYPQNSNSLFAIAAETTTQDSPTAPLRRVDRLGRPEITNVSLVAHKGDDDIRDQYNLDRPFQVDPIKQKLYRERLLKNIYYYDGLDGKREWTDAARLRLANTLVDDFLVVDISKPCEADSYFDIEKSILRGAKSYDTCGGRKPNDDIMDTLFTLYIAGLDGARIRDGVDHPHRVGTNEFPYLAAPDLSIWARTKAFIAQKILGAF